MKTENLSTLKIHKLTQEQYERELAAGNIDATALYLTPDEDSDAVIIDLTKYEDLDAADERTFNELILEAVFNNGEQFSVVETNYSKFWADLNTDRPIRIFLDGLNAFGASIFADITSSYQDDSGKLISVCTAVTALLDSRPIRVVIHFENQGYTGENQYEESMFTTIITVVVEDFDAIPTKGDVNRAIESLASDCASTFGTYDIAINNIETAIGDIETVLDNIISIQNTLIGGDGA